MTKTLLSSLSIFAFVMAMPMANAQQPAAGAVATTTSQPSNLETVEQMTQNWPSAVKESIRKTIEKYGLPHEISMNEVMWHNHDLSNAKLNPFKHIHINRMETPHNFPMPHTDFYKQVIQYRVPADKMDELTAYDGSVVFNRTKGELTAICDKEEMNILAFNLAHDVATGKRSPDDARKFFAQTAMAFKKGEKPEYTQRLMLTPGATPASTADPDKEVPM